MRPAQFNLTYNFGCVVGMIGTNHVSERQWRNRYELSTLLKIPFCETTRVVQACLIRLWGHAVHFVPSDYKKKKRIFTKQYMLEKSLFSSQCVKPTATSTIHIMPLDGNYTPLTHIILVESFIRSCASIRLRYLEGSGSWTGDSLRPNQNCLFKDAELRNFRDTSNWYEKLMTFFMRLRYLLEEEIPWIKLSSG
jgi:hypothetical protein